VIKKERTRKREELRKKGLEEERKRKRDTLKKNKNKRNKKAINTAKDVFKQRRIIEKSQYSDTSANE
jgi:hypothetical protein